MAELEWKADGHRLAYMVTQEASGFSRVSRPWTNARLELVCPGAERCSIFGPDTATRSGIESPCGLVEWFSNVGPQDFMDTQARLVAGTHFELPVVIEWAWEGYGDDAAPVFRLGEQEVRLTRAQADALSQATRLGAGRTRSTSPALVEALAKIGAPEDGDEL